MWFMALSVYTTEYSSRPPAASNGRGDLWYGLEGSCGHCAANARSATRCGLNEPRAATARAAARRRANIGQTRGDVLLSARVSMRNDNPVVVCTRNKWQKRSASALGTPDGTSHEPCPTNGRHVVLFFRYQVTFFSDSKRATRDTKIERTIFFFRIARSLLFNDWVVFGPVPIPPGQAALFTRNKSRANERTRTRSSHAFVSV